MNHATDSAHYLGTRVVQALQAGGVLTNEILAFIDTALFLPGPDHLAAFLHAGEGCERDTLLDLIFYPDQATQVDLEPLLERARCSAADEQRIATWLRARDVAVRIRMPDGRPVATIRLTEACKQSYLERLKITWQGAPEVTAAIDEAVSESLRPLVKVRLRNAGGRWAAGQALFLRRFFERMDDSHDDYLACLDLALAMLDSIESAHDAYDRLVDHKRACFRGLQQARRFEMLLRRSNMETLMLQGVRPPEQSCEHLLARMTLIDRVCQGVFGRTEILELPVDEPLREVADRDNPAAAIQSLWR